MEFTTFDSIKIGLASPEQIRSWSYGVVERPETINYRTQKPERDGLFCERIFGPTKDWECHCGKFKKIRFKGKVCDRCGVEVTRARVRRERMGHIELAAPVSHIWYFKGTPSRIGQVLEVSQKRLEEVLYFTKYIVTDPGNTELMKKQLLSEKEYYSYLEKYGDDFKAEMGAEAIKKLLNEYDPARYDTHKARLVEMGKVAFDGQRITCFNKPTECDCEECRKFAQLEDIDWRNNIEIVADDLKAELVGLPAGQKKVKIIKRLQIIEAFRLSGNKPEWMILDAVPVIPPESPSYDSCLTADDYATSDLNDLYSTCYQQKQPS